MGNVLTFTDPEEVHSSVLDVDTRPNAGTVNLSDDPKVLRLKPIDI